MNATEQTYRKARAAVERVLDEHMGQWEPLEIGVFLKAIPQCSTRAIEGALERLVAEDRLIVARRCGYARRQLLAVIDRRACDLEDTRRAAARAAAAAAEAHS